MINVCYTLLQQAVIAFSNNSQQRWHAQMQLLALLML
jgi:hypothetical protein